MKYRIDVVLDAEQLGAERGPAMAVEATLKTYLGKEFLGMNTNVRKTLGVLEVADGTDLERIKDPDQYRSVYPSIISVDFVKVEE